MVAKFEPVSAIVPVYGGEGALEALHRRLTATLESCCSDHEIVFVDDAGPGDAWRVILSIAKADRRARGIRLAANSGQHNAVLCGVRFARFGIAVTLDDDLQHPPEEIPRLLGALRDDVDLVYGRPRSLAHSVPRNLLSSGYKRMAATALDVPQIKSISAFRAFRVDLRDAFDEHVGPTMLFDALLARGGPLFEEVTVEHVPRRSGRSGYRARALAQHAGLLWRSFRRSPAVVGPGPGPGPGPGTGPGPGAPLLYEPAEFTRAGSSEAVWSPAPIELRRITQADAERMMHWICDRTLSRGIGLSARPSIEHTRRWIDEANAGRARWARAVCERGVHVGNVVLDLEPDRRGRARLSIYLGESVARGRGVGASAVDRALAMGFGALCLEKIWLSVLVSNASAIALYDRVGFEFDTFAELEPAMSVPIQSVLMSMSRQRYQELHPRRILGT